MSSEPSNSPADAQPARKLKISCHNCMQKLDVTGFSPFARFQCPVCGAELIVPAWFDTYLLEERSGNGGMATVYRALDPALDREVAIKVLKPEISGDPERVELFLHEARAAATINHFAVVPIYTCGVYDKQAYIVMQYMGGGTLEQRLNQARDKLPIPEVAVWIRDIAEGLENAMEHGVIHHDVKPGNILLDSDGKARIGDFGIAQIVHSGKPDSEEESIQEIAKTWLSPHYVSPEKVRTGKEGFEGDIYSLGATFYHLLTGIPPFCDENVEELLRKRLKEKPLPPHLHRPEIDMELSRLIDAMLSRSPSDRPSYEVIIATLDRFIKERSQAANTRSAKDIRPRSSPPRRRKRTPGPVALPVSRGSRFPVAGLLLLFVLLAVGAGGLYYVRQQGFADFLSDAPGNTGTTVRDDDRDPDPEITRSLASGDLVSASVFADVTVSDPSLSLKKRYAALFQYACARYLAADGDPRAAIRRRLAGLEDPGAAGREGENAALLAGIRLLAGLDPEAAPDDPSGKAGAELLMAQCLLSAEKALSSSDEARRLPQKIDSLERALNALPAGSWLSAAWKNHIPAWRQTVLRRSGKKEEVEPLFARLIGKTAEWAGPPAFSPGSFPDMSGDLPAFETADGNAAEKPLDLSPASLKSASEKYLKYSRPVPEAPARISGNDPYLKHVPADLRPDEERRFRMMCQLRLYIAALAAGGVYRTDEFTLADRTALGAGEIFFNERYAVYRIRREDGQFENLRLDWDRIPAREVLTILLYYTTYRENAVLAAGDQAGAGAAEKLADAFLRYAVFAQWYGYYDEAAKAAGKARALLPGPRIDKTIEHLLLR